MKKIRLFSLVAFLLVASFTFNSCYGPFNLSTRLHSWNSTVGGKWANTAVFFAFIIIPVYEVTLLLDTFIFNSIEFWGGKNPISMNEGEEENQIVKNGNNEYLITATKNKFRIEQLKGPQAGEIAEICFAPEENSCYLNYEGEMTKLVEYLPSQDGMDQVNLHLPDGRTLCMDADERNNDVIQMALRSGSNYLTSRE